MKLKVGGGVDAGVYLARYEGGEEVTTSLGAAYKLEFSVVGGQFDGKKVSRLVNPEASSPKSNIAKFFAALAGVTPERGCEVDDDDYVGQLYRVVVTVKTSGYSQLEQIIARVNDNGTETATQSEDVEATPF